MNKNPLYILGELYLRPNYCRRGFAQAMLFLSPS